MEKEVLKKFKDICKIPHCSFETDQMRSYLIDECKKIKAEVFEDRAGNILVRKGNPKVCLQAHYDMVCMGEAPKITPYEDGGFLYSKNSSLGADNGVGVAIMLVLLKSHQDLECLFTNDEEVGLLGAKSLELDLKSSYLLNLDSEEEGVLYVGCAGDLEMEAKIPLKYDFLDSSYKIYEVSLDGLPGGHSGIDIAKMIPNAILELAKYLKSIEAKIISFEGGERINSIPTKAKAKIALSKEVLLDKAKFHYTVIEERDPKAISNSSQILDYLCAFPQGICAWDEALNAPLSSSNLSLMSCSDKELSIIVFARAMNGRGLSALELMHKSLFNLGGFTLHYVHKSSPWTPDPSTFANLVKDVAKSFWKDVHYGSIHAGLECGILMEKSSKIKEACSIGPCIDSPHTIRERCEIASVGRVFNIVDSLLKRMQNGTDSV